MKESQEKILKVSKTYARKKKPRKREGIVIDISERVHVRSLMKILGRPPTESPGRSVVKIAVGTVASISGVISAEILDSYINPLVKF